MNFTTRVLSDVISSITRLDDSPDAPYISRLLVDQFGEPDDDFLGMGHLPVASYTCTLCEMYNLNHDDLLGHLQDSNHKANLRLLNQDLRRLEEQSQRHLHLMTQQPESDLIAIAKEIHNVAAKNEIDALLYRYVTDESEEMIRQRRLRDCAMEAILKHEHAEHLTIVALAVWKAQCQQDRPLWLDHGAIQEWNESGWKARLETHAASNAISIIVRAVNLYLEVPELSAIFMEMW